MSTSELTAMLERHGIKATPNRLIVARALWEEERPLRMTELEEKIGTVDKSGIFRTLTLFRKHRLVHAIDDGGEGYRYELCLSNDEDQDEDVHVHFHCERCNRTLCLENIPLPPVNLPSGYKSYTANYLVKGLCPDCDSDSPCGLPEIHSPAR